MDKIKELICFTKIFNKLEYTKSFLEGNIRFTPLKDYVLIENEYRILVDMPGEGVQTINIGTLKDVAMLVNYEEFKKIELIVKSEG